MKTYLMACLAIAFVCLCGGLTEGSRILALFPFPGKSHSVMLNRILTELLARGHEVDVITNFPMKNAGLNYTSIEISPMYDFWTDYMKKTHLNSLYTLNEMNNKETETMIYYIGLTTTEYALQHPNVKQFIHSAQQKQYDVILVEQFFQEAFLMLAHQLDAPVISISTFGFASYFNEMFGSFGAWSHVPHQWIVLPERMTFWQRVCNVHRYLVDKYNRKYGYMVEQQRLADQHFSHLPADRPSLEDLTHRVSAILMNTHAPLTAVKPTVPGLIDVGGLHIDDPRPLPADIKQFIDEAEDGVIFFSFGTQMKSADMPAAQLNAFLRVFGGLKQRVLWKWEADTLDTNLVSKNLMVKKWLPQSDILAHPNVRLFITHGGLLGTQEGVWHGVPMLGVPFYADQHLNTQNAHNGGYAIAMQFNNITETSLTWALHELLHNPAYAAKAKYVSRIFRDRPERAIDRATYWIEYVIRFGGTEHLRSAALDLSWASYFLLDIIGAALAVLLVIGLALRLAVRRLIKKSNKNVKKNVSKKIK